MTKVISFRAGKGDLADLEMICRALNYDRITIGRDRSAALRFAVKRLAELIRGTDGA